MKTWKWENETLFNINRELQELMDNKTIKTVVSMSMVNVPNPKEIYRYTAILIYKQYGTHCNIRKRMLYLHEW